MRQVVRQVVSVSVDENAFYLGAHLSAHNPESDSCPVYVIALIPNPYSEGVFCTNYSLRKKEDSISQSSAPCSEHVAVSHTACSLPNCTDKRINAV